MIVVAVVSLLFCALFTSVCIQAESDEMQEMHEFEFVVFPGKAQTDTECIFFFFLPQKGEGPLQS